MKKILLLSFMLLFTLCFSAWAQTRVVSGFVNDPNTGEGLPGVNVILKGTTTGTTTDIDGNYRLTVPAEGGILQFSFIGLKSQEIEIGARSVIDLSMSEDVETLSEVVVTGYGVEQKRDLTGSIANIGSEVLVNTPLQTFDRALQGRAAGVQVQATSGQPGGGMNIRVRGQGSISNNVPLYIVDGIQINSNNNVAGQGSDNVLGGINPNDIESIEILKDAAAAAIYGAQSANGVVIITTKKGAKNRTDVDISYQTGVTTPFELYDMMDAFQFAEIREEAYINAGLDPAAAHAQFGNPEDPSTFTPYDWVDNFFQNGQMHILNGRVSGGTDKTRFFLSLSHESQEGQVKESIWERQTIRLNLNHDVSDKLTFGTNIGLTKQRFFGSIANGNFVNSPFVAAFSAQPNSPAFDENGDFNIYPAHFNETGAGHLFNYNILEGVNEERREAFIGQVLASVNGSYKILDYLSLNGFAGIDIADSRSYNERPATIPVFAGFGGQSFLDDRQQVNWNANTTLNFNKVFASDHTVTAIVGTEWKREFQERNTATVRGFANPALRLLSDGATLQAITGTETAYQRFGLFARGTYNFQGKYYVNGTIRRDGHSRFGSENRFGNFWSVGASWRAIEEGFLSNVSFLDDLKLRFSYGILGNANGIGDFQAISSFEGRGQYVGAAGQAIVLADNTLSWERSKQANIGIDFGFFNNRLTGAVDVFRNDTEDQLFDVPIRDDSGFGNLTSNAGTVRNEGIEVELSSVNLDVNGFKWTTSFNITFMNNEITALPGGVDTLGTTFIVGQPVDFFWGADYVGVNPANGLGMWRDRDGNVVYGNISNDQAYIIGSPIPDQFGGIGNTFSYKGLVLDVFFQFQLGNEAFNSDLYNYAYNGSTNDNQLVSQLDRWQNPGDVTNVPIAYNNGIVDGWDQQFPGVTPTRYLSDASYVRLKQVTLSYNLPQNLLNNTFFKGINVFVSGTNLVTWTEFDGIDPEVIANNNDTGASAYGVFPLGRQYTGGITLKF